ncbi:MAG TPA: hypothetical protein VFN30_11405 [Chitinophagaceae bacterium]|nr:hypothetical protein [Chitinophagaceae bacterium]
MTKKMLTLSEDQTKAIDEHGNVVYVATKDSNGNEYFIKPEHITKEGKKICVGWEDQEWCVTWDKEHSVCIKIASKKVCIEWKDV